MRITFTGDILIYKNQDKGCVDRSGKRDYRPIFEQVKPMFDGSDYVVGSFETTLAGKDAGYTKADISFNTPDELLVALKEAGFNLLTTANNHCFDRGVDGLKRTMLKIKEAGLEYTGTRISTNEPAYLVKDFDGTKVAFVAYTYGTNSMLNRVFVPQGEEYLINLTRPQDPVIQRPLWKRIAIAILSPLLKRKKKQGVLEDCVASSEVSSFRNSAYESKMIETIKQAKQNADVVIMCLHSGGQFNSKVGAYTQHLFDIIADAGADAIVCNHAHTTLPIYQQGDCLIASALGNFSFVPGEGYWVDGVKAEYSAILTLDITEKKVVAYSVNVCKCICNEFGLAVTVPIDDASEIEIIKNRLGI